MKAYAVCDSWQKNADLQLFESRDEAERVCESANDLAHMQGTGHSANTAWKVPAQSPSRFFVDEVTQPPPNFALEVCTVPESELAAFRLLASSLEWEVVTNRGYQTADATGLIAGYRRAFFLRLPPHTSIHKHRDCGDCETDHIVIETNAGSLNFWTDEAGEHSMHMDIGKRYVVDRTLEHWATNDGDTDRTHLLLEY